VLRSVFKYIALSGGLLIVLLASGYFTMRLVVRHEEAVSVPNLMGADVIKALEAAAEHGLNIKVEGFEYSSNVAKNHILFQEPAPGTSIKRGRDLRLVISRGPEVLLGPHLVGLPLAQALFILEQNELAPGELVRVHSQQVRLDGVIAQYPPPQASLRQGQSVDMLVSAGDEPQELVVPDVRGRSAVEAALALKAVGLEQGQLSMAFWAGHAEGEVLEQRPRAGYKALRGSRVALLVNQGQEKLAGGSDFTIFSYLVPTGLRSQEIRVDLATAAGTRQLHCGVHDGGETVQVSFPAGESGTIIVYHNGAEVLRKRY
jgi:beta-lactam-binding protein with PASTA domain